MHHANLVCIYVYLWFYSDICVGIYIVIHAYLSTQLVLIVKNCVNPISVGIFRRFYNHFERNAPARNIGGGGGISIGCLSHSFGNL